MFPFTLFPSAQIGDSTVFAVDNGDLFLVAFVGFALMLASMWLANRAQPTPDARSWAAVEAARRTAPARGKHR